MPVAADPMKIDAALARVRASWKLDSMAPAYRACSAGSAANDRTVRMAESDSSAAWPASASASWYRFERARTFRP